MKPKNYSPIMSFVFAFTIAVMAVLTWLTTPTLAGSGLPPRDTPSPVKPGSDDKTDRDGPIGTYLELRLIGASAGVWTVVQWQDSAGNWHDVQGWQGTPDAQGDKRWWVAAKDFGTGPFRWVVKQGFNGPVLGMSAPFNLPGGADEIVQVTVLLE
jgi:hypothetical protein